MNRMQRLKKKGGEWSKGVASNSKRSTMKRLDVDVEKGKKR